MNRTKITNIQKRVRIYRKKVEDMPNSSMKEETNSLDMSIEILKFIDEILEECLSV